MNWKKELRDQLAHIAVGATAIVPIWLFGLNPLTGGLATGLIGLTREYTEWQLNPHRSSSPLSGPGAIVSFGSLRDISAWTLIGLIVGFL